MKQRNYFPLLLVLIILSGLVIGSITVGLIDYLSSRPPQGGSANSEIGIAAGKTVAAAGAIVTGALVFLFPILTFLARKTKTFMEKPLMFATMFFVNFALILLYNPSLVFEDKVGLIAWFWAIVAMAGKALAIYRKTKLMPESRPEKGKINFLLQLDFIEKQGGIILGIGQVIAIGLLAITDYIIFLQEIVPLLESLLDVYREIRI